MGIWVFSGSTQEEMGALVQQSINDSKISGGDRPVAWDGETRTGAGLQNQLKQIQESKVRLTSCDCVQNKFLMLLPFYKGLRCCISSLPVWAERQPALVAKYVKHEPMAQGTQRYYLALCDAKVVMCEIRLILRR